MKKSSVLSGILKGLVASNLLLGGLMFSDQVYKKEMPKMEQAHKGAHKMQRLVTYTSPLSVEATSQKFQKIIKEKNLVLFGVFEHSKLAKDVGLQINDTIVIAFGAPKAGTLLMQCEPTIALDLPLKFLIYKNEAGNTIVAYEDVKELAARYGIAHTCAKAVDNISQAQANLAKALTAK